ncbi:Hypothetical protein PMT_2557 [Prochlorococcus marinus str. MIT 9313]|uniref:Uncharacterized protein n=1 Tax=Prochlorococcus marinus (strain MIT 9313) TaxID=74547 RepID=B9ERL9_PROMM|nr:Hypothetical protein PMT_2557 [Prochlorococcus marinus str. MIT 9313]
MIHFADLSAIGILLHRKLFDCSCQFNSVAAASSSGWGFCFGLLIRFMTTNNIIIRS